MPIGTVAAERSAVPGGEPTALRRALVIFGFAKVEPEHHRWLLEHADDERWMAGFVRWRGVMVVAPYALFALLFAGVGILIGAVIGVTIMQLAAPAWLRTRHRRGLLRLHGLEDPPSVWARWPPRLYFAISVTMVVLILGVAAVFARWIDDTFDDELTIVGDPTCTNDPQGFLLAAVVEGPREPVLVAVTFRYRTGDGPVGQVVARDVASSEPQRVVVFVPDPTGSASCPSVSVSVERGP